MSSPISPRSGFASLAASALAACSIPTFIGLPPGFDPSLGGVFVEERADGIFASASASFASARIVEDASRVSLLAYSISLEALGISPASSFPNEDCRLISPSEVFELDLTNDAPTWAVASRLRSEIKEALTTDAATRCNERCARFDQRNIRVEQAGYVTAATRLTSGRFLIATSRSAHIVDRQGSIPIVGCDALYRSLVTRLDGQVFRSRDGAFERLEITDAGRCTVTSSLAASGFEAMSVGDSDSELLGVSEREGLLVRFTDSHTKSIATFEEVPSDARRASLHVLPNGELMASLGSNALLYGSDETFVARTVPLRTESGLTTLSSITAIGYAEPFGWVVGSTAGEIYSSIGDDNWRSISSPIKDKIGAMVAYGDGMLVTIEGGRVLQFSEGELCPEIIEIPGSRNRPGRQVFVDGDDVLIGGFVEDSVNPTEMVWLMKQP
ncbi:MAG: hypothetical protein HY791_34725 [Deltaproteobacteria bacterium]|nr:hypothetical protein [Deltaproteobacteria bacterium]